MLLKLGLLSFDPAPQSQVSLGKNAYPSVVTINHFQGGVQKLRIVIPAGHVRHW